MDLAKLKTEIADAKYSGMGDEQIADAINAATAQVDREVLTGGEIAACVVVSELLSLPAAVQQYVVGLFGAASIPLTTRFKQQIGGVFGAGTTTRANLIALNKRTGTRGEEIGLGRVTPSNVAEARKV